VDKVTWTKGIDQKTGLPLEYDPIKVRPCATLRYSRPRGWSRLWLVPWRRRTGSHVPYESLVELRAAYMPDATRAVSGIARVDPRGRCYGAAARILRPSSLM
jgi:hypothetical protein